MYIYAQLKIERQPIENVHAGVMVK